MAKSEIPQNTVACDFADWVGGLSFEDLPSNIVTLAKECFRDAIACAILGSSLENTSGFLAPSKEHQIGGDSTVIMTPWRTSVANAAFINALYTHGCELDDGFVGSGGHPACVIVPSTLAVAERYRLGGRDVITAIVAGYDVMHRANAAINLGAMKRGFQGTGTGGPFGSAAAVAKLRRLPSATIAQAFGIAGSYCSGLMEYDHSGGESKRLYAGNSARAGVESVAMAEAGVTGPLTIFEGPRGVWSAFSDESDPELSTGGLGTDYRITRHKIKTYPTVGGVHGGIDAITALSTPPLRAADISRITVKVIPVVVRHGGTVQVPWDMLSAQFSLAFSVALRVQFGRNDLDLYQDPAVWSNPEVIALCKKVDVIALTESEMKEDPSTSAIMTITFSDGSTRSHTQHAPTGTPGNPLTPEQIRERFFSLTRPVISETTQIKLDDAIGHLESLETLDELLGLLQPESANDSH